VPSRNHRRVNRSSRRTDLVRVDVTVTQRGDEAITDLKMEDLNHR
jgi:hypothetical protein